MHELKQQLRRQFRCERQSLPEPQRLAFDGQINTGILNGHDWAPGMKVAAFAAFDGEPNIFPALTQLHQQGIKIFLPAIGVNPDGKKQMHMCHWQPDAAMRAGVFGIRTPTTGEKTEVNDLDVIMMPLVAWDASGHRLGMGAGFYDRYLEPVKNGRKPLRAGIAYSVQRAEILPAAPYDIDMHCLVTENGWIKFEI